MCDEAVLRVATYVFMIAGGLSPLVAIVGGRVWPERAVRVAIASLVLFLVAGIAGALVMVC